MNIKRIADLILEGKSIRECLVLNEDIKDNARAEKLKTQDASYAAKMSRSIKDSDKWERRYQAIKDICGEDSEQAKAFYNAKKGASINPSDEPNKLTRPELELIASAFNLDLDDNDEFDGVMKGYLTHGSVVKFNFGWSSVFPCPEYDGDIESARIFKRNGKYEAFYGDHNIDSSAPIARLDKPSILVGFKKAAKGFDRYAKKLGYDKW